MSDLDKMVPLGEIVTRDGVIVPVRRDYEDLFIGGYRFTPQAVGQLEDKIDRWKHGVNDYLRRGDEAAADDSDVLADPVPCAGCGEPVRPSESTTGPWVDEAGSDRCGPGNPVSRGDDLDPFHEIEED